MVPDVWVYREADRLITAHGAETLGAVDHLIDLAARRLDADRVLLMLRVRLAVTALQAPPIGPLH
jgi:hypothetical protein